MEEAKKPMDVVSEPIKTAQKPAPKAKAKLDDAEKSLVARLKRSFEALSRDKAQEPLSFGEYVASKLTYLERLQLRNLNRSRSEMPKELTPQQKIIYESNSTIYAEEIALLKSVIGKA